MLNLLLELKNENVITELNYQFARMINDKQQRYNYSPVQQNLAILVAALVSFSIGKGHSAIRLTSDAASNLFELKGKMLSRDFLTEILQKIEKIQPLAWQENLANHVAFSDNPNKIAPILFQNELIYFYRYWQAENKVAAYLQQAVEFSQQNANMVLNKEILGQLFPQKSKAIDWQKVAVATALQKNFSLISGGPGTGKTKTVVMLLAGLQLQRIKNNEVLLNIALVAPTGKAAARMKESIENNLTKLEIAQSLKDVIPKEAMTIHRLLGVRPLSDKSKYNEKNPLHYDLIVVDEASMIDLALMEKLMQALKPTTRLIMLGDKDQLASVEVGSIMGELGEFLTQGYSQSHCEYLNEVTGYHLTSVGNPMPICDSLCHLRHSFRFDENSGIGHLAMHVNNQNAVKSWELFDRFTDLECIEYPSSAEFNNKATWVQHCVELVITKAVELYRDYLTLVQQRAINPQAVSVAEIFAKFQHVRFLSALRISEFGVDRLNQMIAEALRNAGLIHFSNSRDRYIGKPILITENAPANHIYSGDIGIILPSESGEIRVYFDTLTKESKLHSSMPLSRIPNYEAAYIMTVHKSQGSEFAHTLFVLPLTVSPVLTKELIYTAITRASGKFTLFGDKKTWQVSVKTKIQRQSGLMEQLKAKFGF